MKQSFVNLLILVMLMFSPQAFAGGDAPKSTFNWEDSPISDIATQFVMTIGKEDYKGAYLSAGEVLRSNRSLDEFSADMKSAHFDEVKHVIWDSAIPALPANGGFKLRGTVYLKGSVDTEIERTQMDESGIPVYIHLQGDAHVNPEVRNREWNSETQWSIMDYRSSEGMTTRFSSGTATPLDWLLVIFSGGLLLGFLGLIAYYVRGLWGAPRELYLLYFTKLTEYSAYGSASAIMVLFLQNDVMMGGSPLGDSNGYLYYTIWTLSATVITMMVGAVCDTIGVRKCLLVGAVMLMVARFFTPLTQDIFWVTILGFVPLAIGFAITGPVLKVGIKKFTTMKQATLGFGLFYTLMNVGFAVGAEIADYFRNEYGDTGSVDVMGINLTTYQLIILIGFLLNIPDFIAILFMRDGAEMTENGLVVPEKKLVDNSIIQKLIDSKAARRLIMNKELLNTSIVTAGVAAVGYALYHFEVHTFKVNVIPVGKYIWSFVAVVAFLAIAGIIYASLSLIGTFNPPFDRVMKSVRDATQGTIFQLKENFTERPFWIYMGMLAILIFVRLTFYIFHLMFPTYAIRVFGADFPVASIFGTLNPVMIIFLVPLISVITVNVRSYTMLLIGTALSAASVFLCFMPETISMALADSWFGVWVFDYWLEAPIGNQAPFMMSLVVFIMVFTVGEAIWSPRLMQFSAEIAPRGKEGAYIALSMLPYFLGKAGAGVLSEQMTTRYFNDTMVLFPNHQVAWFWVGAMAAISPIGLIIFRKTFANREREAIEEAERFAAETKLAEDKVKDAAED